MTDFTELHKRYLAEANKRREQAKRLRQEGLTFAEIGKRLGVSRQRVHSMIGQP
jgi:DNA-binding transcriptional regulator LsrR (DeoR family)